MPALVPRRQVDTRPRILGGSAEGKTPEGYRYMCQWCEKFADGHKRWFLNPSNYAARLYKMRKQEAESGGSASSVTWFEKASVWMQLGREYLEAIDRGDQEAVARMIRDANAGAARFHFGQVVTLEEAHQVLDIAYPIGLTSCTCRREAQGVADQENFTCMSMGPGLYKWERWPNSFHGGLHFLGPEEAKEVVTKVHKRGLVSFVYTLGTPFAGALCQCDYPDCLGIRARLDLGVNSIFKGHYVARLNAAACTGCAKCIKRCQFRTLSYIPSQNKAYIDMGQCFGCGLCATVCPEKAISMVERATMPALANNW